MTGNNLKIKLLFVEGLQNIVEDELSSISNLSIVKKEADCIYTDYFDTYTDLDSMRSVSKIFLVEQNPKYTPRYISNHKSILGNIVSLVIANNKDDSFKTFKISCAGSGSPEVRSIASYIEDAFKLSENKEADLKIHIIKKGKIWECGVEATPRPLSARDYKMLNMSGAMNPTIAYAVNSMCNLKSAESYLNVFSGSATLLIEAASSYPNLKKLIGFDNSKEIFSLALQNIKKAGLMRRIQLKGRDIFEKPDLGKFDAITSDLPFGMTISKGEDLEKLYECFVSYCEETLDKNGGLVAYTNEHELLKRVLSESKFKIEKTLELKLSTTPNGYIYPKIFVCSIQ